jgi:hypothetical protein
LIGGALSLVVGAAVILHPQKFDQAAMWWVTLVANGAHFAASTVRLYVRPGAVKRWPLLTIVVPLLMIAVTTLFAGPWFDRADYWFAIYSVWSPFHYAAQAFGLSMMYTSRAQTKLTLGQRRWIRAACFVPFVWFNLNPVSGLWFLLGEHVQTAVRPHAALVYESLRPLVVAVPLLIFVWLRFGLRARVPFIAFLIVASNAIWWTLFDFYSAFVWATIFHSLQYLVVVEIFHVRAMVSRPGNRWPGYVHGALFYVTSFVLAFLLFAIWPQLYIAMGWSGTNAYAVIVATINVHHFIVDGFIWKLRSDPGNRAVVESGARAAVAA